jgi:pantoate--beta-alanine ligase
MITTGSITEIRGYLKKERENGRTVGLVPTMGYLHEGHLSLMRRAREECDYVVISIFVNPKQFGPAEDFDRYPRDPERDKAMAEEAGADVMFAPGVEDMYPAGFSTYVYVKGPVARGLCAASRPNHFRGVTTVCAKLFDIVQPDKAYFGQKDFQQTIVVKKVVKDLDIPLEIVMCPIVREPDGLAMSSRNVYLNAEERKAATVLYRSLKEAEQSIANGLMDTKEILDDIEAAIADEPLVELEYASICDTTNLNELDSIDREAVIALAVKIGKTRLIDNVIVNSEIEK